MRLLTRALYATRIVDQAYRTFEGARRELVLSLASDRLLASYNDFIYGRSQRYHPASTQYLTGLHSWEESAIAAHFPAPPARILVGAAGGGREAFALVERGYVVAAFEPSPLADRMSAACDAGGRVEAYRGRYEDLPIVRTTTGQEVDLSRATRFDAGILGWGSFSHLPSDQARVGALQACAALVNGPLLVSFFGWLRPATPVAATGLRRRLLSRVGERRPGSLFSVEEGLYRQLTEDEMREMAACSGLEVAAIDMHADWPNAVLRPRRGGGGDTDTSGTRPEAPSAA